MTGSRLAALLDQMDAPGSGLVLVGPRIFTLEQQRDMARLLVDMADDIREIGDALSMMDTTIGIEKERALLARFAALDEKAGAA